MATWVCQLYYRRWVIVHSGMQCWLLDGGWCGMVRCSGVQWGVVRCSVVLCGAVMGFDLTVACSSSVCDCCCVTLTQLCTVCVYWKAVNYVICVDVLFISEVLSFDCSVKEMYVRMWWLNLGVVHVIADQVCTYVLPYKQNHEFSEINYVRCRIFFCAVD